jgi:hypothetical protein
MRYPIMGERKDKVKIKHCVICGKEFNKYVRPWGIYSRATCSDYCQTEYKKRRVAEYKKQREIRRHRAIQKLVILLVICFILGGIGAVVGGYIYNAMGMYGNPSLFILIGFLVGFFGPMLIYLDLN